MFISDPWPLMPMAELKGAIIGSHKGSCRLYKTTGTASIGFMISNSSLLQGNVQFIELILAIVVCLSICGA